jgi:hypothetical protein
MAIIRWDSDGVTSSRQKHRTGCFTSQQPASSFGVRLDEYPSKFCGSHDVDDAVAFKVLHRGEWVYPDDVDLD